MLLSRWIQDETDRIFLSFPLGLLMVSLLTFYLNLFLPSLRWSLAIVVLVLLALGGFSWRSSGIDKGAEKDRT